MNMPGFRAEASLYRRTGGYRASINIKQRSKNFYPAQLWSDVATDFPPPLLASLGFGRLVLCSVGVLKSIMTGNSGRTTV
jgi:hypothetical protein